MNLIKKIIFNQKIEYLFWGAMTTLVYFVTRFASMLVTPNVMIPVAIAQVVSILFAFVVNKYLVFNGQQNQNFGTQFIIFLIGRAIAAGIDFLLSYLMIQRFVKFSIRLLMLNRLNYHFFIFSNHLTKSLIGSPTLLNSFVWVFIIQIIIIVINFIVSKYFAFK